MLGTLDPQHKEATIVGAGISGMLLAEKLDREGWRVTLLEAAPRAGGLIETKRTEQGIAEAAAHSLLATPAVTELCSRLGVRLAPVRPHSRARFIWRKGRLRKMPLTIGEMLRAFARAYFVLADSKTDPAKLTLEQWGLRHLGRAVTRYLLTPFVRGIYGCQPEELGVAQAFPSLVVPRGHSLLSKALGAWVRRLFGRGDPKKPRSRMVAPIGGMGALAQALEARLRERLGDRFRTGHRIDRLPSDARNLILCVPTREAARLLADQDAASSRALAQVRYSPLVSITAFVDRLAFLRAPCGVGVLLPEGTSRRSLGVLFNSSAFPGRVTDEEKWVSLTVMMGGSSRPDQVDATITSDEELRSQMRADLEAFFGLAPGARIESVIHRWPRAVPQYNEILQRAWDAARAGWCSKPGRALFGNYTGQVSVRGMIETVAALSTRDQ